LNLRLHLSDKRQSLPRRPPPQAALAIGFALLAFQLIAFGQRQNPTEDQVKAAYLLNFAKLAEWPSRVLPEGPSPLVIGVSGGDDAFLSVLKAVVAGKTVGTHLLEVRTASSEEEMKSCHIVFFRASESKRTQAFIASLAQADVLFVGESESFLRQGGMIDLVKDHGSVRFEVNSDALDRSHIHFSSKILALARSGYGSAPAPSSNSPLDGLRRLQHSTPPPYPELAERMKLTGTAQVQALVRPDGTVKEVKIVGGHPVLADALARAVMQWTYQPAPRETVEVVKFSFGPQ
jgi:TonB family protein